MPTYPLPTLAAQISSAGISAPAIEDILESKIAQYQGIYGSDVLLEPDDQDYQSIAAESTALNDANNLAIAVYNSFLPGFAQGNGLSALVQINGLKRETPTNSTVDLVIVGVAGTPIQNGVVRDQSGNLWNLPELVTIPNEGQITVTATAQQAGAISSPPNTVNVPYTILSGWQSVTNPNASTPGAAVEQDSPLRQRQAQSTSLPAITPLDSILAAVANSGGVGRYQGYQNVAEVPDANGIPAHGIAIVVEGGDATAIATAIQRKKAPGTPMAGNTSVNLVDQGGIPVTFKFYELSEVPIYCALTIHPLVGYVATTGIAAVNALVSVINALPIGQEVYINWLIAAASLSGNALSSTFAVTSLTIGLSPGSLGIASIPIPFNSAAQCSAPNVILTTA